MRKINRKDVAKLLLVFMLVAGLGMAYGAVGRFVPTHKIVQPVYCGSCHPEQVNELSQTTHLGKFANELDGFLRKQGYTNGSEERNSAREISSACMLCHNYWENMKWFGVANFALTTYDNGDLIGPQTDIYGNAVSPYGLGSTHEYLMNVSYNASTSGLGAGLSAIPWSRGLDTYQYSNNGVNYTRVDVVWSALSAVSPGPVGFNRIPDNGGKPGSCGLGGTAEHGMCHIGVSAITETIGDQRAQVMNYTSGGQSPVGTFNGKIGNGIFFTHEMAFTTAQYAAKPVKICGACHVLKLPPMQWGGEPWAISDIEFANNNQSVGTNDDPFGWRPTYNDLTGTAGQFIKNEDDTPQNHSFPVMFRTPDWAHANVPCIRCHSHAGINGETVTSTGAKDNHMTDPSTGGNVNAIGP